MNMKLNWVKELAQSTCSTLAIINGEKYFTSSKRGVRPLYEALTESPDILKNGYAADKITGRASAWLMVLGGVKALYTSVISESALQVLENAGIEVRYDVKVDHIINRSGDGICPMEKATMDCQTPQQAFSAITDELKRLGSIVHNK